MAIPKAQHSRVPEPTAKSALADAGPLEVASVGEDATVLDALNVMAERDVSAVAVVSQAGVLGVFSERVYARRRLPENRTARDTPVVEMMAEGMGLAAPADSVRRCLVLMDERRATHVAVVDQQRLVGLLSRAELLAALIAYHERIFHETEMEQKLLFLRGTYSC